jgi:hypothetical protein
MKKKMYSLHPLQTDGTILIMRMNVFGVEHEEKSLDYRPLMNVINQCEANSPLMSMRAKVPEYILRSANRCAEVEPLARSDDQGTLMYSHDRQ